METHDTHTAPVLGWADNGPGRDGLHRAAGVVRDGGVVVYPTETVYGLGCDALNPDAVRRVFRLKARDGAKPLPVIVPDIAGAERMAASIPAAARRLMAAFWPGPLTIILEAAAAVPRELHAGTGSVGMRISSGSAAAALCRAAGTPLVATSANRSGEPAALDIAALPADIAAGVDLIIDGGACTSDTPSTVVDMQTGIPRILRPGPVDEAAILRIAGVSS